MIRKRLRSTLLHALALVAVSAASYFTAYQLRFAGEIEPSSWAAFKQTAVVVVGVRLAIMLWLGQRHAMTRYFSFHDLLTLVRAVTVGTIGVTLVDALLLTGVNIPRGVVLLDWGTTLLALAALNSLPRLVNDAGWNPFSRKERITALIVGANDGGEGLLRAIRRSPKLHYDPIGFVDDRPDYTGRSIGGVPVLGSLADIPKIARRREVEEVLITSGELPGRQVRKLVDLAGQQGFSRSACCRVTNNCCVRMSPSSHAT